MTDQEPTAAPVDTVSVVLLTYNCGHRLDPILDRLLALDVPVIAVDNGSADDTVAVLRGRPGIEVIRLDRNIGAAARTVGIERAETPYVACCDDDGWWEPEGLRVAAELLDDAPKLAVVNARILVGDDQRLDPISAEMAQSPLEDRAGIPGQVLIGFMAGAVVVRRDAILQVGGYDPRYFIGGEEETLALPLLKAGWEMRYVPEVVMHHQPSTANVDRLRGYGVRNTLWTAWLHRPPAGALRWTAYTLLDRPLNKDWVWGVAMALRGLPWVLRNRSAADPTLEQDLRHLDRRRFAESRNRWVRSWA
jgi:GT2 family glycosyltransferase